MGSYVAGAGKQAIVAARRALRLSPRDPFSAIFCGIAGYAQFVGHNYDEAMRLAREGTAGSAAISSVPTAC